MRTDRLCALIAAAALCTLAAVVAVPSPVGARLGPAVTKATCDAHPWTSTAYQATSTPSKLAATVVACLELRYPSSYLNDEVAIVGLVAHPPYLENVNELPGSPAVSQLASLGIPPITLEDGPGGLITPSEPAPTQLPNELALGATFDPSLATSYGSVLGTQAHDMGYDGVQAPDLSMLRVETWGRAMETFGESPVLTGEMGGAEAIGIESAHEIAVLKHFSPYSQDTGRQGAEMTVTNKALQEVYVRPFTFALRALIPQLEDGGHAVGVMCSYGFVNGVMACRTHLLANELRSLHVNALVRTDLNVKVQPKQLVVNGVDLIKPLDISELLAALKSSSVKRSLTASVEEVLATEFADGLVDGSHPTASVHPPPSSEVAAGDATALAIEQRAAVLLKNTGVLPLSHDHTAIDVVADTTLGYACHALAASLDHADQDGARCSIDERASPQTVLFSGLPHAVASTVRTATFTAPSAGPYVVTATTLGNTELTMDGQSIVDAQGLAQFAVARTALVQLAKGQRTRFALTWKGAPPSVTIADAKAQVDAARAGVRDAKAAIVLAYDLDREGMDRSSLQLPGAQNAVISAVASRVPTIVVLVTDGPVSMPWLDDVDGVLEVWSPTGAVRTDSVAARFAPVWANLLDGRADPSGRLDETFPKTQPQSPAGNQAFWPGVGEAVDLDVPPDSGVALGMAWYRDEHWPVLFPFGYGLSYTTYSIGGGTLQSSLSGLSMSVSVTDTGSIAGDEPIQVYADWPGRAEEPRLQLVGFGVASFSTSQAMAHTAQQVTIALAPDAFTVYKNGSMQLVSGRYCLEAATYDGDPAAWSSGSVTLSAHDAVLTTHSPVVLTKHPCPS